jgi:hypothetical protein
LAQQPNRPAIAFRHLGLSHNANSMTDDMAGMDAYFRLKIIYSPNSSTHTIVGFSAVCKKVIIVKSRKATNYYFEVTHVRSNSS